MHRAVLHPSSSVLCRQFGHGLEDGAGAGQGSEDAVLDRDHVKRRLVRRLIAAGAGVGYGQALEVAVASFSEGGVDTHVRGATAHEKMRNAL